ncbi:MAG: hypothetical protein JXA77_12200 [Bacteroidales bacterium]|nr:hypothetical protein [Bacteroidales bacterium]MBN2821323.1 hypothetical protein [Bacteroidales bacterium]
MNEHRYILEKGSKKHLCPECDKKRFVRYIDTETGQLLPEQYGRCDRESNCGYFLNPYTDGYAKMILQKEQGNRSELPNNWKQYRPPIKPKPKPSFIPVEVFKQTLSGYEQNVFIQNLLNRVKYPFEVSDIEKVISLYNLGTVKNGYRKGAITFPFIDIQNKVRAIQVKQFDETNHTTGTDFLHSIIEKHCTRNNKPLPEWLQAYNKKETKVSCLFGEHLLNRYKYNPVALIEAPKTAVYCSLYFGYPEHNKNFIWLAVYNLSSLNLNKCQALRGRDVFLFPDLSKDGKAFELWSNKAKEIEGKLQGTKFHVSDLLEKLAPEQDKEKGNDIADYLIKQDWQQFRKQSINKDLVTKTQPEQIPVETSTHEKSEKSEALKKSFYSQKETLKPDSSNNQNLTKLNIETPVFETIKKEQPQNWNSEIKELETYFTKTQLPTEPIKLNQCSTILNTSLFIESHFATVKANNGNRTFLPYLKRLQELKQILTINSK